VGAGDYKVSIRAALRYQSPPLELSKAACLWNSTLYSLSKITEICPFRLDRNFSQIESQNLGRSKLGPTVVLAAPSRGSSREEGSNQPYGDRQGRVWVTAGAGWIWVDGAGVVTVARVEELQWEEEERSAGCWTPGPGWPLVRGWVAARL